MHVKKAGGAMRMRQVVSNVLLFMLLVACAGPVPPSTPPEPPAPKPEIRILDPRDYPDTSPRPMSSQKKDPAPMQQRTAYDVPTQQVDFDSKELRRRLLRLIDSLQSREAVSVANVEKVMGLKLYDQSSSFRSFFGYAELKEKGWSFNANVHWVYGDDAPATIEIALFPDGPRNPKVARSQVCSFEMEALAQDIVKLGFSRGMIPGNPGKRRYVFSRDTKKISGGAGLTAFPYVIGDDADSSTWVDCLFSINMSWTK